jgi:hypothetical protein
MPLSQENQVQMALPASISKKKNRLKMRVAKIFCVPKTTLLRRLKEIKPWLKTYTNSFILYSIKEEVLLKWLLKTDKQGFLI